MKEPSELDRIKLPDEPWVRELFSAPATGRVPIADLVEVASVAKRDVVARDALCALARCGASFIQIVRAAKEMEKL